VVEQVEVLKTMPMRASARALGEIADRAHRATRLSYPT
jgi:hypothetical protein